MRKGLIEFCVQTLLKQGDAYASQLIAQLKQANMIVVEGTLYPLLTRLKNDGLLAYRWEESPSGPPRKFYTLTPVGEDYVASLRATWIEVSTSVNSIAGITSPIE